MRADGVEVTPAALSTGTREQLWLAVRLAYVRQYCDASEPLPLILDDPLVNFDAARARATLKVLAAFAERSQVLMLTCHAHLVALARESRLRRRSNRCRCRWSDLEPTPMFLDLSTATRVNSFP